MKTLQLLFLLALCITSETALAREFTSADGRKVNGDIIAYSGDQIVLKVGQKEFVTAIGNFSIDDQQYIKDWIKENPGAIQAKVGFYIDLKSNYERSKIGKAPGNMTDDKLKEMPRTYDYIVYNRGKMPLTDIEIRYEIYIDDFVNVRDNSYTRMATGATPSATLEVVASRVKVDKIEAGKRYDLSREFIIEYYVDRDGGRVDESAIDKVLGTRIRVYKDGVLLGEDEDEESNSRGIENIPWKDAAPTKKATAKN